MRVLLLAPQPFYQERGTPIAVDLVLRSLSARWDDVDVLTYHEGASVDYPGVRLHRIPRLPFVRGVGPGPTLKKLLCDAVFFFAALRMARRTRYDLVHAVEESVFVALVIKRVFGFTKVRYQGLAKNAHRLVVTCALANLFMARRHLLRCQEA